MVVISDLHCKNEEPFLSSIKQFLEYLIKIYPDEEFIHLGDLWDSSSPFSRMEYEIVSIIKKAKKWHQLSGNHDQSRRASNALFPMINIDNIIVYDKATEVEIEGFKCLVLPWIRNAKEVCEQIEWKGDYCFNHLTNKEDSFNGEFVDLSKVNAYKIYGHTHTRRDLGKDGYVMGVNLPTRNLEIANPFIKINAKEKTIEYIDPPKYFEYQTLNYGEFPENKNNILNIKQAPSYPSVYEMYKGYYIRKEGIEILRTENDFDSNVVFETGNIIDKFNKYAKEKELNKEVISCANEYLQEVI